ANKVRGCASQVWLVTHVKPNGAAGPVLSFEGDSDAHIVRGLIAILFALYSGKAAKEILDVDALALFDRIGLRENLTPQRSNGLRAMVEGIGAGARGGLVVVEAWPGRSAARSDALQARDRFNVGPMRNDPGSAARHFMPHRIRDKFTHTPPQTPHRRRATC